MIKYLRKSVKEMMFTNATPVNPGLVECLNSTAMVTTTTAKPAAIKSNIKVSHLCIINKR